MLEKPKSGFVLGKFLPPHNGHVYMCEFAREYCKHLTILVCSLDNEPIPGKFRHQCMKEMFPDCTVVHFEQPAGFPQEPTGPYDYSFWEKWKGAVRYGMQCTEGDYWGYPEVVFASEGYGHRLADEVGARFVPVDIDRTVRNISGTTIRKNPFDHWDMIPNIVKPYFTKRVVLFGPESSGKTTLANELGYLYNTVVAPEYGRTYTETFGPDNLGDSDFARIVAGHRAGVKAASKQANKILIEDTDPLMTAVWSIMLTDHRDPWFEQFNDYADLYILCGIDIPWEDDGTRYFKEEVERQRFYDLCRAELVSRGVKFIEVSGILTDRLWESVVHIDKLIEV